MNYTELYLLIKVKANHLITSMLFYDIALNQCLITSNYGYY